MLRAVIDGRTYEAVAAACGVTCTTVERRVKGTWPQSWARREHTYEIDAASLMLATEQWIPVEGVHELSLVYALIEQRRRFVKPLRYDAHGAARFANAMLLDVGLTPLPLHVFSPFMTPKERELKEAAVRACERAWVWPADETVMPVLPAACP